MMLPVILRVRCLQIYLHRFFSGKQIIRIRYRHCHFKLVIFLTIYYIHITVSKIRITQTIAKRIGYRISILIISRISGAHNIIFVSGLIIAVSHVNAFLINHIIAGLFRNDIAHCTFISGSHKILHSGRRIIIEHIGIHQTAGRIYLTCQNFADCFCSHQPYIANPQHRIDVESRVRHKIHLHGIGRI